MHSSMSAPEARTVHLGEIVEDSRFQVRLEVSPGTVEAYANALRAGVRMPPVQAATVNGALVLVDGWHRVAAHRRLGLARIEVEVVEASEADALWMAAKANLAHGLQLKPREVRRAFGAFMRARKYRLSRNRLMPFRDIARHLGGIVHHETIRRWMLSDFPNVAARYAQGEGDRRADPRDRDPSAGFAANAEEALRKATAAARGVSCPKLRGELVRLAEGVLREVREGGPHEPPEEVAF